MKYFIELNDHENRTIINVKDIVSIEEKDYGILITLRNGENIKSGETYQDIRDGMFK